jgi:hypothetical protein
MFKGMEQSVPSKQDDFTLPPPAENASEDTVGNEKH